MGYQRFLSVLLAAFALTGGAAPGPLPQQKDYLTEAEADRIRDADSPALRIKLYLSFAEDRLKKFEYERARPVQERRRSEILNTLLNAYVGCVDDASDQIDVAHDKQMDIHDALKSMVTKEKDFLGILQKYNKPGPDFDDYQNTLEDAIEGTKDAISDAEQAQKEMLPAPVRRKP
jgi:tagatose-1,6-bisphosphate aldolase